MIRLVVSLVVMAQSVILLGADPLSKVVEGVIADELEKVQDIEDRFEKGKLKPAESALLFGKKTLSKEKKLERIKDLRDKVTKGEVSFRTMSLNSDLLKVGDVGVLEKQFQQIDCQAIEDEGNVFVGTYSVQTTRIIGVAPVPGRSRNSRDLIFENVPGGENLVAGKSITITCPMVIVGRRSDTFVFEPLSVRLERIRKQKK